MASASMNGIKTRMKSVTGTMQITKAMELVATSKLRRARERAESARPFFDISARAIASVLSLEDAATSRYVRASQAPTLYIVIAGDRGLAGGYNSNVFRAEAELSKGDGIVLPIGKKAQEHYRRRGRPLLSEAYGLVGELSVGDAFAMAKLVCDAYTEGRVGRVELVYTQFVSMISQQVRHATLLPLTASESFDGASCPLMEAEEIDELLDGMIPAYIGGRLHAAVAEAAASESGARRTAMNAANKNAEDMLSDLKLRFNRARQSVITQELTEIVSGADAL